MDGLDEVGGAGNEHRVAERSPVGHEVDDWAAGATAASLAKQQVGAEQRFRRLGAVVGHSWLWVRRDPRDGDCRPRADGPGDTGQRDIRRLEIVEHCDLVPEGRRT